MVPSLPLLSCESSVSVKENPDRKKKKKICHFSSFSSKNDNYYINIYFLYVYFNQSVVKALKRKECY